MENRVDGVVWRGWICVRYLLIISLEWGLTRVLSKRDGSSRDGVDCKVSQASSIESS